MGISELSGAAAGRARPQPTCLLALPHALKHQLAAIAPAAPAQNNHLYLDLDLEVSYNSYLFSPKAITDKSAP